MFGPVLEGRMLRLRPPRLDDAAVMITWFEDMEVTRFLSRRFPPSLEAERDWLQAVDRDPDSVVWVIEVGGEAVGTCGIHLIDWQNRHAATGTLIGDRRHWGRGVATEMMRMRTAFAFRELNLHTLHSGYLEGNEGSGRAQAGAGYQVAGRRRQMFWRDGRWHDEIITQVMREDWEAAQAHL